MLRLLQEKLSLLKYKGLWDVTMSKWLICLKESGGPVKPFREDVFGYGQKSNSKVFIQPLHCRVPLEEQSVQILRCDKPLTAFKSFPLITKSKY